MRPAVSGPLHCSQKTVMITAEKGLRGEKALGVDVTERAKVSEDLDAVAQRLREASHTPPSPEDLEQLWGRIQSQAPQPNERQPSRLSLANRPYGAALRWVALALVSAVGLVTAGPAALAQITAPSSASAIQYCSGCTAPTIAPSSGPPGTVFDVTYACPAGTSSSHSLQVSTTDGQPLKDVTTGPSLVSLKTGIGWIQGFEVGPDGQYAATISCGTPSTWVATIPFQVTAERYVALGDSYASGEGASSFTPQSSSAYNACHRSATQKAWVRIVAQAAQISPQQTDFAACSGALIDDFVGYNGSTTGSAANAPNVAYNQAASSLGIVASSAFDEVPQLDHVSRLGATVPLTSATNLVTLTVGGNNVGFPSVLGDCIKGPSTAGNFGCQARDQAAVMTALGWLRNGRPKGCSVLPGINAPFPSPATLCSKTPIPALHTLYEAIAKKVAPGGEVLVVGYPELFGPGTAPTATCSVAPLSNYTIRGDDVTWLNAKALQLDSTISGEVTLAQAYLAANHIPVAVKYVEVNGQKMANGQIGPNPFQGHRICDTGPSYFHALVLSVPPAPFLNPVSFHPTDAGQQAYGSAIVGFL
jgi:hypothetical protein